MEEMESTKTIGSILREAREKRGWSLEAAAKASKIRKEQLVYLEEGKFGSFPSYAYVKGFVRTYARTLGLDEKDLLPQLEKELQEWEETFSLAPHPVRFLESAKPIVEYRDVRPRTFSLGLVSSLFLLVCSIVGYKIYQVTYHSPTGVLPAVKESSPASAPVLQEEVRRAIPVLPGEEEAVPALPAQPAGSPSQTALAPEVRRAEPVHPEDHRPEVNTSYELAIRAKGSCWVQVSVVENGATHQVFAGKLAAGERRTFSGQKFRLRVANPASLEISINGQTVPLVATNRNPEEITLPTP
ncbi:helix-turn-helix domain-containing protein [Candidatus Methylacidithermus pantelleriae]|uniref:Putative Predicted transcriptional regulator contains Xre-like HTH domain n=1 Tax=Candidatus Methylacidithermus pantelleriae TaxID=2744239 RepID=A0A8J2FT30_9BACT|nr:RodZ domain-containing protein [Candidatus Methylacidithermus pantelleriae]CAF0702412.1 putative Predicted transcriptional regulator contains Xre-like HTH domain [Candidatus Methylacidithermus pantelleriae]